MLHQGNRGNNIVKPERNRGNWLIADKRYEEPIDRNDIIEDAREVKLKDIFSPSRKGR